MIVLNNTRTIRYGALIPKVESHTKNISFETLKKIIANYLHLRVITKHHSRTLTAGFNLALQNGYKMGTWYQSADLEKRPHTQKQHRIWSSCRKPALNGKTKTTYGKKSHRLLPLDLQGKQERRQALCYRENRPGEEVQVESLAQWICSSSKSSWQTTRVFYLECICHSGKAVRRFTKPPGRNHTKVRCDYHNNICYVVMDHNQLRRS